LRGVVSLLSGGLVVATEAVEGQISGAPSEPQPKKAKKRSSRAANIDAIKKALREHLVTARDYAFTSIKQERGPSLLPRPTQEQLAAKLNVSVASVSRAINDRSDRELPILWNMANDVHQIMKYKG